MASPSQNLALPARLRGVDCPLVATVLVRVCLLLLAVGAYQSSLSAQAYSRMEIGSQGVSLTLSDAISGTEEKGGFGARATYNFSPILAWDVEGDFSPVCRRLGRNAVAERFLY